MKFKSIILSAGILLATFQLQAQGFYDTGSIQKIEITFPQANWDYQMDTAKIGSEGYLMASAIAINGTTLDSVGVRYKGNSSYDSSKIKNPLHIQLDEYKSQKYNGVTDIKLSNCYADPSMIREVLSYAILKNYMHCPLSTFAQLYINGNYIGLYSSDENIDKKFCADHFYSSQNTFVKCNPTVIPGPTTKSNFKYISVDSSSYQLYYEMKSKNGWQDLISLCNTVTNNPSNIDNMLDMDRAIWMLAFNNLLINLDSYNGVFAQNHYAYKDNTGHFNPVIWDLNMSFGAFPFPGAGATSMGTLNISGEQTFPTDNHATDTFWPLINVVQSNATYKRKYIAHMRTILNEFFANHQYDTLATQYRNLIDTAVQNDTHKFYSYVQFQQSLDSSTPNGSYTIPGIRQLMDARVAYLQSTSAFTAVPPTITGIISSVTQPTLGSTITLKATITNADTVWAGYRFDKREKFIKVRMYDDGSHNDGAANDNQYGVDIQFQGGIMDYYLYAENNNAGIFSPARAEHEFYQLKGMSVLPTIGNLVINEILSTNTNGLVDEYNQHEDWIELYNNSNQIVNLDSVYLSNDAANLNKWHFPAGTTITPQGYLTLWADDDASQQILHANFSLNKDSGFLALSIGNSVLDSLSFTTQQTDTSYGRYPNGTGSFIQMNTTYGAVNNNYPLHVSSYFNNTAMKVYPNPAHNQVTIEKEGDFPVSIYRIDGLLMYSQQENVHHISLSTADWAPGNYIIHCGGHNTKLNIVK